MDILGIDIGGSSLKAAPVNPVNGCLTTERLVIPTPEPSAPETVANCVMEIINTFDWRGPIGCGLPSVIRDGVALTAANIDKGWIDTDVTQLFLSKTGHEIKVLNDADAAGLAEMHYGAGRKARGTTLVVTAGTGLGTALFRDNTLVPNCELGHILLYGEDAEKVASAAVRTNLKLSYQDWAKRFNDYLVRLEELFWPDLFIIGGEISADHEQFLPHLTVRTQVVPAALRNNAGIIGAATAVLQ